jgi:hypothetical protein
LERLEFLEDRAWIAGKPLEKAEDNIASWLISWDM